MEKMTMKAYAVKHKLSLFNVVKLVKSGKVKSETVTEDGKETVYIIMDDNAPLTQNEVKTAPQENVQEALEIRVANLEAEVKLLRRELQALKEIRL